jgi:hypothetical protein
MYDPWGRSLYQPEEVMYGTSWAPTSSASTSYAGLDWPSWQEVERRAKALAHELVPSISPPDAAKAKKYAQAFGRGLLPSVPDIHLPNVTLPNINLPNINLPNVNLDTSSLLGQAPQKVSDAADAATAAAREHEETMRIVKYAVIGVGALGGLALLWSIAK